METIPQTSKDYFNSLKIIHFALLSGQLIFAGIAFALSLQSKPAVPGTIKQVLLIAIPLAVVIGFLFSLFIFKKRLDAAKIGDSLIAKMNAYRSALIMKYAPLEGVSFLALIAYTIAADYTFLVLAALIIVVFAINQPSLSKSITDLNLTPDDEKQLRDRNAIIAELTKPSQM
ncbi:MAG: hypothetical protein H6536_03530 [Bacteroidales bacterium]|nr:hypothetical protein [Bacteroidales bacterium]